MPLAPPVASQLKTRSGLPSRHRPPLSSPPRPPWLEEGEPTSGMASSPRRAPVWASSWALEGGCNCTSARPTGDRNCTSARPTGDCNCPSARPTDRPTDRPTKPCTQALRCKSSLSLTNPRSEPCAPKVGPSPEEVVGPEEEGVPTWSWHKRRS